MCQLGEEVNWAGGGVGVGVLWSRFDVEVVGAE